MSFDDQTPRARSGHEFQVLATSDIGRVLGCECGGTRVLEIGAVSMRFSPDALLALEALLGLANARDSLRPLSNASHLDPRSLS